MTALVETFEFQAQTRSERRAIEVASGLRGDARCADAAELHMRRAQPAKWWSPEAGSAAAVVQAVVRYLLATLGVALLFALPGLLDLAGDVVFGGGAR